MVLWVLQSLFLCCIIPIIGASAKLQRQPEWIQTAPQFLQNLYKQKFNEYVRQQNGQFSNTN